MEMFLDISYTVSNVGEKTRITICKSAKNTCNYRLKINALVYQIIPFCLLKYVQVIFFGVLFLCSSGAVCLLLHLRLPNIRTSKERRVSERFVDFGITGCKFVRTRFFAGNEIL